jgi:hypothetical protein
VAQEHSQAKLLLVDKEYLPLVANTRIPMVVCHDTGRAGDPYEDFLSNGKRLSEEKGWKGLSVDSDENAPAVLCYTCVKTRFLGIF